MPKIPVFEAREQIITQAPEVRRPIGAARRPGEELVRAGQFQLRAGASLAEIGRTVAGIGQAFAQARDLEQFTKAKTNITEGLTDIENKAFSTEIQTTEDFNEILKASTEELEKIKGDVLATIANPDMKIKMEGAFDLSALATLGSIKRDGRKRWTRAMKFNMMESVDTLSQKHASLFEFENDERQQAVLNEIKDTVKSHIELGVINRQAGNKYLKDTLGSLPTLEAKYVMGKNPTMAREMLGAKLFGIKDSTERKKLLDDAIALEKSNVKEAQFRLNMEKNNLEQQVSTDINNNNITDISTIETLQRAGKVSDEYAAAAKGLIKSSKKIDPVELATGYDKLTREYYALPLDRDGQVIAGLEQVSRFRINLIKARTNGIITESDFKNKLAIINGAYTEELGGVVKAKFLQGKEIRGWWDSLWTRGERGLPEEDRDEAMMFLDKELTKVLLEKEIPEGKIRETAIGILKKYIQQTSPEILGLEETPNGTMGKEKQLKMFHGEQTKTIPERRIITKPNTILMQSPDGKLGTIPTENFDRAIEAGYKVWQREQLEFEKAPRASTLTLAEE